MCSELAELVTAYEALREWVKADDVLIRAMFLAHDDPNNEQNRELASKWTGPLRDAKKAARDAIFPEQEPTNG
jgi:isochorismate hydrolase